MDTRYVRIAHTTRDPEGLNRQVDAEIRVEPSEEWDDHLQITVNTNSTGRELINLALTDEQVVELRTALTEYLATRTATPGAQTDVR